jgi:CHASE2 domain-containing sensor protein
VASRLVESNTLRREPVDIRGRSLTAVTPEHIGTEGVDHDQDEVSRRPGLTRTPTNHSQ